MHAIRWLHNTSSYNKILLYFFCAVVTRICPRSPNGPGLFPQFGSLGIIRLLFCCWVLKMYQRTWNPFRVIFSPEKTDWFSRIWQQFRGLAHFGHCCHNLNCSSVADTSASRDPNQGDVRKGRGLHYLVAQIGGFSPLLPCPLIISGSVLVLACKYEQWWSTVFVDYFQNTSRFLRFAGTQIAAVKYNHWLF